MSTILQGGLQSVSLYEACAGSFLVVPCGQYKQTMDSPTLSTAYVYARGHWNQPFLRLPATNKVAAPPHLPHVSEFIFTGVL